MCKELKQIYRMHIGISKRLMNNVAKNKSCHMGRKRVFSCIILMAKSEDNRYEGKIKGSVQRSFVILSVQKKSIEQFFL